MNYVNMANKITSWLLTELDKSGQEGFVVGLSGGVDSALVATLCAGTFKPVHLLILPLAHELGDETQPTQYSEGYHRAVRYAENLIDRYGSVTYEIMDISSSARSIFRAFGLNKNRMNGHDGLVFANACSRIRMTYLYAAANQCSSLVVGTGNKVEDFGAFFYTKYGDGGVDLSPIADLYKSEVREMARSLRVPDEICDAVPSDELWADVRSDEQQLGVTYDALEKVMKVISGECELVEIGAEVEDGQDIVYNDKEFVHAFYKYI